jgi:dCMP deaminase
MRRARSSKTDWLMDMARLAASRSEDPYVQVGAVAVREDYTVIGLGYNGAPPGVDLGPTWADREKRRPFIIHAEMNAIRYAVPGTIFAIFTTHIPCEHCMSVLGSYRTSMVVYENSLGETYDETTIRRIAMINEITLQRQENK